MDTITLDQTVSSQVTAASPVAYELDLTTTGKMVVTFKGPTSQLGVYGPFVAGAPLVPGTGNGFLKLCGDCIGIRTFPAGRNLLYVTTTGSDNFTLSIRPWYWWDYVLLLYYNLFKKSEC